MSKNDKLRFRKKRSKSQLDSASDVLQSLLQNGKSPLSEPFIRWRLWNSWPDVVGELHKYTLPVGFDQGKLILWVSDSARMQELIFFRDQIRQKVNDYLGRSWVRSVQLTMDRKKVPKLLEKQKDWQGFFSK